MKHLRPEELIDAMDGVLDAPRRAHLDACDACRREAVALHALMADVRASDVPEPSPLFWDRLSARVREAIDEDTPARSARWFDPHVLVPLGAFALVVLAIVSTVSVERDVSAPSSVTVATARPAFGDPGERVGDVEAQWAVVADMIGQLDVDVAYDVGLAPHAGVADRAILELSVTEQQELIRLLEEELRGGS